MKEGKKKDSSKGISKQRQKNGRVRQNKKKLK